LIYAWKAAFLSAVVLNTRYLGSVMMARIVSSQFQSVVTPFCREKKETDQYLGIHTDILPLISTRGGTLPWLSRVSRQQYQGAVRVATIPKSWDGCRLEARVYKARVVVVVAVVLELSPQEVSLALLLSFPFA
jgi:hypothetical protein